MAKEQKYRSKEQNRGSVTDIHIYGKSGIAAQRRKEGLINGAGTTDCMKKKK